MDGNYTEPQQEFLGYTNDNNNEAIKLFLEWKQKNPSNYTKKIITWITWEYNETNLPNL